MPFSSVAPLQTTWTVEFALQPAAWLGLEAVSPVGGLTSWPSARATFRLPPVLTAPEYAGVLSTLRRSVFLSSSGVRVGRCESTRAAAPATGGEAMEVP